MKQKKPPIPEKMELISLGDPGYTRQQWQKHIQDRIKTLKKVLRKKGSDQRLGLSEPMIQRRTEALLDLMPFIERKYGGLPGFSPSVSNTLGRAWVHLNVLASTTYNSLASHSYILYAAALWILDQLADVPDGWMEMQKYLPKDEDNLDDMDWPPIWDAYYDYLLIQSVVYAIENRNTDIAPMEIDASQNKRVLTSDLTAKGKHHEAVTCRRNFESILEMIPQERIDTAVAHYKKLFLEWLDQYFECLSIMVSRKVMCVEKANAIAEEYNRYREEAVALFSVISRKPPKPTHSAASPLVMNPLSAKPSYPSPEEMLKSFSTQRPAPFPMGSGISAPDSRVSSFLYHAEQNDSPASQLMDIAEKMEHAVQRNDAAEEELDAVVDQISAFTYNMSMEGTMSREYCAKECGEDVTAKLKEIKVSDPYELCFALLYLIDDPQKRAAPSTEEQIDVFDLPWLYGAGTSFMQFVAQFLPWAFEDYDEEDDPVWPLDEEEAEQLSFIDGVSAGPAPKKPCMPDFYERRFLSDDKEQRNLAQLIYEETGCVVPRDMEKYADRVKELRAKGARSKDLPVLMSLITLSGYAKRQRKAINLDQDLWMDKTASDETSDPDNAGHSDPTKKQDWTKEELFARINALQEQAAQYQEQNKRLRASVHELEQKTSAPKRRWLIRKPLLKWSGVNWRIYGSWSLTRIMGQRTKRKKRRRMPLSPTRFSRTR